MDAPVVVAVVLGVTVVLLLVVLAPWRGLRRDALDEHEYYALLSGETPGDEPEA